MLGDKFGNKPVDLFDIRVSVSETDGLVSVPDNVRLFDSDFEKDGSDLILLQDGVMVLVVEDYFVSLQTPDLVAANGAVLRGSDVTLLAGANTETQFAQLSGAGIGVAIGQVEIIQGGASVQRNDGSIEALAQGSKIFQNDVIMTGADGSLSVTFADGTIFSLTASSRMIIDELIYEPEGSNNSAAFNLVQGGFVFIAGQVAKTGEMDVNTPTATMGIRGTTVQVDIQLVDGISTVSVSLNRDPDGGIGSIELFDLNGDLISTITATDTKWVISPDSGVQREEVRSQSDLESDSVLIADAVAAYQAANTRVQQGETFVDQSTAGPGDEPAGDEPAGDEPAGDPPSDPPPPPPPPAPAPPAADPPQGDDSGLDGSSGDTGLGGEGTGSDSDSGSSDSGSETPTGGFGGDAGPSAPLPIAIDYQIIGPEDGGGANFQGSVLGGGTASAFDFAVVSPPANGTVDLSADGNFSYVPDANFFSDDSFEYSITNTAGVSDTGTVSIQVDPVNDVPVATSAAHSVDEDGTVVAALEASDIEDDTLQFSLAVGASHGTVVILTDGTFSYRPDANFNGPDGFTFAVADTEGATTSGTVSLTVADVNDAPELAVGAVAANEDGVSVDADLAALGSDVDSDDDGSTLSYAITTAPGAGSASISGATLSFDPGADFQDLALGETREVDIGVSATDRHGASALNMVTITVTGTNDAPVITSSVVNDVITEPVTPAAVSASGTILFSDADVSDTHVVHAGPLVATMRDDTGTVIPGPSVAGAAELQAGFSMASDGTWTFSVPATSRLELLSQDYSITLEIDVTVTDDSGTANDTSTPQTLTITLVGTNDVPVIASGVQAGSVTEISDNAVGELTDILTTTGSVTFDDIDFYDTHTVSIVPGASGYRGSFTQALSDTNGSGSGSVAWNFDVLDGDLDDLAQGQQLIQTYDVTVSDNNGGSDTQTVTVTITGTNDAPVISTVSGGNAGAATAAGNLDNGTFVAGIPSVSGALASSDVDTGATTTWSGDATGTYGSIAIDPATGVWTYTLDNTDADTQALAEGASVTDIFTMTVTDDFSATATQDVTVTITGTNGSPVITTTTGGNAGSVTESGADANGGIVDAGIPSIGGTLTSLDVDTGATATWSGDATGTYGTIAIDPSTGAWTYTLDNADGDTDALAAGETDTETFTVTVTDDQGATATQDITVTLTGTNDAPTITSENLTGGVTEPIGTAPASVASPSGLVFTDTTNITLANAQVESGADNSSNPDVVNGATGALLSYTASGLFNTFGTGTYGAHNLDDGDIGTSPTNQDGFYAIPNAGAGSLVLDLGGTTTISSIAIYNGYGNRTDGNYTLKDGAGNVLGGWTVSGTAGGTNDGVHSFWLTFDAPVTTDKLVFDTTNVEGGTNSYREIQVFGEPSLTDSGSIAFGDVDLTDVHLVSPAGMPVGSNLGALTAVLDSDTTGTGTGGQLTWSYAVAPGDVNYLAQGETRVESFTVTLNDQNGGLITRQIDVTITGTNDAPAIQGSSGITGNVIEAGNLDDGTVVAGTPVASGTMVSTDADVLNTTATWSGDATGIYGDFSVDPNTGVWTYTLNNSDTDTAALAEGDSVSEAFTVTVTDDQNATATQDVTITVTGTNDSPVAVADVASATAQTAIPTDLDALVVNDTAGSGGTFYTQVLTGDGAGGFTSAQLNGQALRSSDIALGDFDGDGDLDAFVGVYFADGQMLTNQGGAQGGTEGTFTSTAAGQGFLLSLGGNDPTYTLDVEVGDVDGDGDLDVMVANWNGSANQVLTNQGGQQGGTEGTFVASTLPGGNQSSREIKLGDIDGDGDLDAVVATDQNHNQVMINQGGAQGGTEGTFAVSNLPNATTPSGSFTVGIALADIDGDGDLDVVSTNILAPNEVLFNDGNGNFTAGVLVGGTHQSQTIEFGDLDGDGDLDAIIGNINNEANQVLINQGGTQGGTEGSFIASDIAGSTQNTTNIQLADIDNDGDLDAVLTNNSFTSAADQTNRLLINDGSGNFTVSNLPDGNGPSNAIALGDLDGDGAAPATLANGLPNLVGNGGAIVAPVTGSVATNDSDVDTGAALSFALDAPVAGLTMSADGSYSFDPSDAAYIPLAEGETTDVVANYTVTDEHGASSQTTMTITVTGVNDAPVVTAVNAGSVSEDDPVHVIDLLAGQSDPDTTDTLHAQSIAVTSSGGETVSFTDNGDGTVSIDPAQFGALNDGESRTLTVGYAVSDGIAATANTATLVVDGARENLPPVANDDALGRPSGPNTVAELEANDTFANAQDLDGLFTFNENPNIAGSDTLASVNIVGTGNDTIDYFVFTVPEAGTTMNFDVDFGADFGAESSVFFDSLITLWNDSGAWIAENDDSFPVDPGSVESVDSNLTYTFSTPGTYFISVGAYPECETDSPVPSGGTYELQITTTADLGGVVINENTPHTFAAVDILGNDTDPDGDTLTVSGVGALSALGAAVSVNGDGSVHYDPTGSATLDAMTIGDTLSDTVSYTISDGNGGSDSANLTLTVSGVNDAPIAVDDAVVYADHVVVGNVAVDVAASVFLANDTDPENDLISLLSVSPTSLLGGSVVLSGGNIQYDPTGLDNPGTEAAIGALDLAAGETLTDTYTYTAEDEAGLTDTASVTVDLGVTSYFELLAIIETEMSLE